MKRVMVTGACGFIGSHLAEDQHRRGRAVTAVDLRAGHLSPRLGAAGLEFVEADFRAQEVLERLPGHDVCFHLASLHLETGVDEGLYQEVNVRGTRRLLEACREAGVGRFVYCSSVGVYGDVRNPPADEETPCHPDITYERSKLAAEKAVLEFARETGYPVVVLRPAWVYGPRCPRTLRLFRAIARRRFIYIGDGGTLRHPVYIDDMVRAFEVAATHPSAVGETFIVAGPRWTTIRELVEAIAACLEVPAPKMRVPRAPVALGLKAVEAAFGLLGRRPPVSSRSLKFFSGNTAFRTDKAARHLGYKAEVDLGEGLRRTLAWYLDQGLLPAQVRPASVSHP